MSECIDEFGLIPYSDMDQLATELFEEVEPQPRSKYDLHQEAIFHAGMEHFSSALEAQQAMLNGEHGYEYHDTIMKKMDAREATKKIEQINCLRNELLADKVVYEMKRGNHTGIASYLPEIDDYQQKLRILDVALRLDDDEIATSTLMLLGDLRAEAEAAEDLDMLRAYVMVELRNNMNVHANIIDMSVLEVGMSEEFTAYMEEFMYGLMESGQIEYAKVMAQYARGWTKDFLEVYADALRLRQEMTQRYASPKLESKIKGRFYKKGDLLNWLKLYIAFPEVMNETYEHIHDSYDKGMAHNNVTVSKVTQQDKKVLRRGYFMLEKVQALRHNYGTVREQPFDIPWAENKYKTLLKETELDYNELFRVAAQLTEHVTDNSDSATGTVKLDADIELARSELATTSLTVMNDLVDKMRYKQESAKIIKDILQRAASVADDVGRFRTLASACLLAEEFNSDLAIEQYRKRIANAATQCLNSPVSWLEISKAEIVETCERLGIKLGTK